jgi:hypothetical protein
VLDDQRARLAVRVVLERLIDPVAVVPAVDDAHVLAVRLDGLRDESQLRVERERDVTHQAAKELVADGARRPLGHRAEQIAAAEPHMSLVGGGERRHDVQDLRAILPSRASAAASRG